VTSVMMQWRVNFWDPGFFLFWGAGNSMSDLQSAWFTTASSPTTSLRTLELKRISGK